MSVAELLVVALVALWVIGPQEWPRILKKVVRCYRYLLARYQVWQQKLEKAVALDALSEREEEAQAADRHYQSRD